MSLSPPDGVQWRQSSRCNGGTCLEVSMEKGKVRVRNSADPIGAILEVSRECWQEFLTQIKKGHFGEA